MLRRSCLLPPGRFFYASSSPILRPCHPRIPTEGAVRKFATQTGATTPSDRKGSSNQFLKLGFGIAALGAVAAYISIERPDIFKFSKHPSSEKPSEKRSEGPFKFKKGDTVEIKGDGYKETGTNLDVTFDGSGGEIDSTHKESEYVKERNKDENVHKDLSSTKEKLNELPSSQVEAYASAESNKKMSSKEGQTSAKLKNASDKEAHISEESHKKASDNELKKRYGTDKAVHGVDFTTGDAVSDTGKADDAMGGYVLPHDGSESSVSSDKNVHSDILVKDLDKVRDAFTFLEILHAAEERQAASDAHIYNEARKRLKEKYEEEVKDARAKELMYAEEASRLEKELAKEKLRASAALKLQREEAAERFRKELKQKEEELELMLNKSEHLAKAQLAAAIVQGKEAHVRDMKDVQLKFGEISIALRELSFVPFSGGGFFTHALARLVSAMKVKEYGEYSDGIEAVISKVERYLGEGRIADAADLLEKGVHATKAQNLAAEWIRLARNRAVMEQALVLLQAHATVIASSLT